MNLLSLFVFSKKKIIHFFKKKKSTSEIRSYLAILLLIGIILGTFYFFYIRDYNRFYRHHYYEYFTNSAIGAHLLKEGNLVEFWEYYSYTYVDKLIFWRGVITFFFFGISHFNFFYSNFIFNFILLIILFKAFM